MSEDADFSRHLLMCPPVYFTVDYSINVWMRPEVPVEVARAMSQWERIRDIYRDLGHVVETIDPVPGLPDMVFTANGAVVVGGNVLVARFRHPQRTGEEALFLDWFKKRGFPVVRQSTSVNEGEGDFVVVGERLLAGSGFRSDADACHEAQDLFRQPVSQLSLVDPRFYHLDTAIAVLDENTVAYYPPAFSGRSRALLRDLFPDAVLADEADALAFGLNAMSDGRNVVMAEPAVRLRAQIRERGFEVIGTDISELLKSGGGVKCCTLELRGVPPTPRDEPVDVLEGPMRQETATVAQLLAPPAGSGGAEEYLRLHFNESPYGAPAAALAAGAAELAGRSGLYPDHDCTLIRRRIAGHLGVSPDMVMVANGTDELILLTALAFLPHTEGTPPVVALTEGTFPGYASAASAVAATVRRVPMRDEHVPPDDVVSALREGARLAFVCNPHNPSGTVLDRPGVEKILDCAEETGGVPVFDEAYMEFAGPEHEYAVDAVRAGRRALVLRTFSKAWGLAGLRIGYAVGPVDLVDQLRRARNPMPFSVNRIAQHAAAAALDHPEFVAEVRERTAAARERLRKGLDALGLDPVPSAANFVLVRSVEHSETVARRLAAEHRILVRDLTPLGKAGCLRIAVGTDDQVDRLCDALSEVLQPASSSPEASDPC